jgi:hypothetical protein
MSRPGPRFSRREALWLAIVGSVAGWLHGLLPLGEAIAAPRSFLTGSERATLLAAVDRMIPPDDDPGGAELGAADYIEGLLAAFAAVDAGRSRRPRIFGGGPFSGRHGGAARFGRFVRLTRVQEIAWRMRIEGSLGLPEREFNGPVRGLQSIYRDGLAELDDRAQARGAASFAALLPADRDAVLHEADPGFVDVLYQHTVEATYAPPEYGGNRRLRGWRYIGFEGDRQPLGYSRYDAALERYVEYARTPVSGPEPTPDRRPRAVPREPASLLASATDPLRAARRAAWRAEKAVRGA